VAYWNHNVAYHPLMVAAARHRPGDVLDVGCGEGLLVERLAAVSRTVRGIDCDEQAVARARARLSGLATATAEVADFMAMDVEPSTYDMVTMVASLHHLDLESALLRARTILRPEGTLVVVGLAANKTAADYVWSALVLPLVRSSDRIHRERRDIGLVTVAPSHGLREIRRTVARLLPGSRLRRGLYYRYILTWTKPVAHNRTTASSPADPATADDAGDGGGP